jgi:hypothetical protein
MDKTTKTILIIIGSLFLLCACTVTALFFTGLWSLGNVVKWADNSTSENPQEVTWVQKSLTSIYLRDLVPHMVFISAR